MTRVRLSAAMAFLSLTLLGISGCGFSINRFSATEEVTKSFRVQGKPRIVVDTFNGSIGVVTGDADRVKVTVTKRASGGNQESAEADLENIDVDIDQDKDGIHVVASPADHDAFRNRGASVELEVPPGAVLELHTNNGKIVAAGEIGDVSANSTNGGIEVDGSKGKCTLETSNGKIIVKGGNDLHLKTSNGGISVTAHNARVDARTSNGSIHFEGRLAEGDHSFQSSNGKISLSLPADASFHLDAKTSNGKIRSDFAVGEGKRHEEHHLRGSVGDHPDTSIKLTTSNSGIEIRKK